MREASEPGGEQHGVALRNEIQRWGCGPSRLRRIGALAGVSAGPLLLLLGWFLVNGGSLAPMEAYLFVGLLGLIIGLGFGVPISLAMLHERRIQLRRRLAGLPREQQLAVLLPLQHARGDTRRLVAPLLRQLHPPAELTPAESPQGRGDEPSPSEQSR
jgi:hypothetical protein